VDEPVADDLASHDAAPDGLVESAAGARRVVVELDPRSFVGILGAGAAALVVYAVATTAPAMVTRVAVGIVLGVALSPLAAAVQRRWGTSRAAASAIVGASAAVLFAVVVLLVAPPAVRQAEQFSEDVPATVEELYDWPLIGDRLREADARENVQEWIDELPARLDEETLADVGQRLLGGVITAGIVLMTALGVLFDGEHTVRRVRTVLPERVRPRADRIGHVVYETFGHYFAGSLLVAGLNGVVILTTGLLLGVPLAPIAAVWAMFTNLIPQIGGFLGGSFFVLLALTDSPATAAIAAVVFLGYQQFENNVIGPAIVGNAVNLSPPTTMLAALVGGAAAGVPGALVATPLLGAAKAVLLERCGVVIQRKPTAISRLRLRRSPP
jgi:predicted PurR-regulated permease PerM